MVEREAPPQLAPILDVAKGEQPEPDRRRDRHQRRQRPSRLEAHLEERRPALEVVTAGQEGEQQEGQEHRFLPVAGLEQREADTEGEQENGGVVGNVQPARDPLRHHQERHADHAAEEVRRLEDPERQEARQGRQATRLRRRRTREEQHHSGEEGEDREHLRRDQQRGVAEHGADPRQAMAVNADLVADQDREAGAQRQQVIDDAVEEQRGQDLLGSIELRELDQHHAFEDADASRHLAQHADELRRQEGAEEHAERWSACRQQRVEHGGGEHPVEHREPELREGQAERRDGELETAHAQWRQMDRGGRQVSGRHRQQRDAGAAAQRPDPVPFDRRVRVEGQAPAPQSQQPEPIGARAEQNDAREVAGADAPARIEAVPHRRSGEQRQAGVVRDRDADEGRHRDAPAPDRLPDVEERELVVTGQHRIAGDAEDDRPQQPHLGQ